MCACDSGTVESGGSLRLPGMPALPNWQLWGRWETLCQKSQGGRCMAWLTASFNIQARPCVCAFPHLYMRQSEVSEILQVTRQCLHIAPDNRDWGTVAGGKKSVGPRKVSTACSSANSGAALLFSSLYQASVRCSDVGSWITTLGNRDYHFWSVCLSQKLLQSRKWR